MNNPNNTERMGMADRPTHSAPNAVIEVEEQENCCLGWIKIILLILLTYSLFIGNFALWYSSFYSATLFNI
jgi:hypothetical protein